MKKYDYKIYIPSGNPTALVIGLENDEKIRKEINDEIIAKYDDFVEQVGFVNPDINKPELCMAGGEFCGNATRSAIKYYLGDKEGSINIKVSGVPNLLQGGIDNNGMSWVDMPIIKGDYNKSVTRISENSAIVKMYGITHYIVETGKKDINEEYTKEQLKKYAFGKLEELGLTNEDAAGVIFTRILDDSSVEITPIVYVKAINTLFYETACGSGTTAVAVYLSNKYRKNIDVDIKQPYGQYINVRTISTNDSILNTFIKGEVQEYKKVR